MKFLYTGWLFALLILPLAFLAVFLDEKKRRQRLSGFIDPRLWKSVIPEFEPKFRMRKGVCFLIGIGFLFVALARPQWGSHEESVRTNGLDLMIVLDVSNSMEVEDVVPSRLKKAKHVIRRVLDQLGGDRVGLVTFAESSSLACPLTTDLDYVWQMVELADPSLALSQGTDVAVGLDTALGALERGAEGRLNTQSSQSPRSPEGTESPITHVVLLISDGEDHEGQALEAARRMKAKGIHFVVVGVGTEKGGPIPIKDAQGNAKGFKRDRSSQVVVSSFHPDFLKSVAQTVGGRYWTLTDGEDEVNELLQEIGAMDRQSYEERRFLVYEERFQIPLAIGLFLLFLELSIPARRMKKRAPSMQIAGVLLFVVVSGSFLSQVAWAEVKDSGQNAGSRLSYRPSTSLDVYLDNKKGVEAFRLGQLEEARKNFGAAQARDPSRPELDFNQGVIEMESGDADRAIQAFRKSAQSTQDSNLKGKAFFNLGKALEKKGDVKAASQSYIEAIESAKQAQDRALEQKARKNLQLLVKQNQPKKEKDSKDKESDKKEGDKESKSEEEKGKKGQSEDQKPKEDQSGKESENKKDKPDERKPEGKGSEHPDQKKKDPAPSDEVQDPSGKKKNKFESKKMTSEDAQRAMSELMNREMLLKGKLQENHGKSQNNPKDW